MDLKELGITKEELATRVVDKVSGQLLSRRVGRYDPDEDGEYTHECPTEFSSEVEKLIKERIHADVARLSEAHILPHVTAMVEDLTLHETTKWGEKKGAPVSFTEYLIARAGVYLEEEVNAKGESRPESRGYDWKSAGPRLKWLVRLRLRGQIEKAMGDAVERLNASFADTITATVKDQLAEFAEKLKIKVSPG